MNFLGDSKKSLSELSFDEISGEILDAFGLVTDLASLG